MFPETYRGINDPIVPSQSLIADTLSKTKRRGFPLRRLIAGAAAAALCVATPALAAQTEIGYQALYLVAPAAAQFFQPVQKSCTDNGVTMEVVAVHVEGDTAQAYITLTGSTVDETTDLYDSYNFHLPFDQTSNCQRVDYDPAAQTATFLCTTQTMSGKPIPVGGKMTFSVGCFLSGKETAEDVTVNLNLAEYASEAATAPVWHSGDLEIPGAYLCFGSAGELDLDNMPMLLPGSSLADPIANISITAAGYADNLFHIQTELKNRLETDSHCFLWLEDAGGNRLEPLNSEYFTKDTEADRKDYLDTVFDVSPADLSNYTLHGDFYTSAKYTEGNWRITFPLVNQS